MAATVKIMEHNGAGGTQTDKTSGTIRFKNADDANVDLNDPLVVPSSGQEYSYEKWLRARITDMADATQISNLRAYTDGSSGFGAGVKLWAAICGSFSQPVIPAEGNDPPNFEGNGSPSEAMTDAFGYTSGSPADLDGINAGPWAAGSPEEDIGDFLVLVMEVETGASNGVLSGETLTFAYDEI